MRAAPGILILIKIFARYHTAHLKFFKGKFTISQTPKKNSIFTALDVTRRCVLFFSFHGVIQYVLFINPIMLKAVCSKSAKQALNSE